MDNCKKSAWAEIDSASLSHNIEIIKKRLGKGTRLCGILKGDAYGHGMALVKPFLEREHLVDMFACGKISELEKIFKETGTASEVLLLGASTADEIGDSILNHRIPVEKSIISVCGFDQFHELEKVSEKLGVKIRVHIRVDEWNSGIGIGYEDFFKHEEELLATPYLDVCGLYGHLYTSYDFTSEETLKELRAFDNLVQRINPKYRDELTVHVLNSALIFRFPEYSYDMVRSGTAIYGLSCGDNGELQPVMSICGTVFSVKEVDAAAPLSYDEKTRDTGKRKIARVMLGYADCPLLLTQKEVRVLIRGKLFSLAEEACMDNLCIDVTGSDEIEIGDRAVILGDDGIQASDASERNGLHLVHSDWMSITAGRLEKVMI